MNYELSHLEWKLSVDQLNNCFLFIQDIQYFKRNTNNKKVDKTNNSDLEIKVATFKALTTDYKDFFLQERFRIRYSFQNHQIKDSPEKFLRYFQANYEGLLKLEKEYQVEKPANIDFNSANFFNNYKELTEIQIRHDLLKLCIKPILEYIKQEFANEIILPYQGHSHHRSSRHNFTRNNANSKLKWRGPINKLITIFYELTNIELIDGKPILAATPAEISDLILDSFVDNNGNDFSNHTVRTILQPGRADKRSPVHKKYNIPL